VREEGVLSLWRGWGPNVNRAMLMTAGQVATYDVAKTWLLSFGFKDNLTAHFSASLMAVRLFGKSRHRLITVFSCRVS